MFTPDWESSPGALAALLNGAGGGASAELLDMVDLYTITLHSGLVLRYVAGDEPMAIPGTTWNVGPFISRSSIKWGVGITVDTLNTTLAVAPDSAVAVNGVPLIRFIAAGGFDGADVLLQRMFGSPGSGVPTGLLHRFEGQVADVSGDRYQRTLTVRSHTALLDKMVPADLYQPPCKNDLFDGRCGVARSTYLQSGTAASATNAQRTAFDVAIGTPGYFDLGVLTMTSGLNAGISRTVRQHTATQLVVAAPWPFAVAAGHTFNVLPGCAKTQAVCDSKFGNLVAFRGEPYVPAPDTVL